MRRFAALLIVAALLVPFAAVNAGPAADQIRLLEDRVADLEARVTALENAWTPSPTPSATPSATPSPTPSPTPVPIVSTPSPATPSPTATPSPSATPTTTPQPTSGTSFGSRPSSGALSYSGNCPSVIENKTLRDLGADVIAIRLENCDGVTIRDVDFLNVAEGVYALNSTNITIIRSRYQNITGPYQRVGKNRANFIQLNNVTGALIADNKGRCGDTEDIVSVYRSSNVEVARNHFEGVAVSTPGCLAWRSSSGSGIALGDSGGSGNWGHDNIVVTPGQVGMFIAGGTNHRITDNIIIGEQRAASNVGLYVWNQSSSACSGHTVSGNRVHWRKADGSLNGAWNAGNCSTVSGWSTNTWNDTTLRASDYRVSL